MGYPPPPDAPPLPEQAAAQQAASLVQTGAGASLCGFEIPSFAFNLSFRLPDPLGPILDFPPSLNLAVAISCDLERPFDVPEFGGRKGTLGLDDDPEFGPDS